ncbi:hypothetical protein V8C86DRAFT_1688143 [Haematococcus lacustris]
MQQMMSCGAAPPMAPPPPMTKTPWRIRPYRHPTDYGAIVDICKDVYGGTDYIPRMLPTYTSQSHSVLLVAEHEPSSTVHGIVCADLRGHMAFVFGLRVQASTRGCGLGRHLMAALCGGLPHHFHSLGLGPVHSLATETILSNTASQRIVRQFMPRLLCRLDMWPPGSHLSSYEKALGWPAQQAGPTDPGILDHIEGVQETLAADKEAAALLPRWERASSLEQVNAALRGIRAAWQLSADVEPQAGSFASGQGPAGDGVTPSPTGSHQAGSQAELHQWLPGFYDMHPTDSHWCSEQLQQGRLWLLPADTDQVPGGAGYLAVMCLAVSVESRRWCAGIVSSCNAATHAALMHAASQQRHFVAFLDRGLWYASSTEAAADPSSAAYATGCANEAPAVYALAAPGDALVYAGDAPCQLSLQHLPHQPNGQQVQHKDNVSSSWQQPTAA